MSLFGCKITVGKFLGQQTNFVLICLWAFNIEIDINGLIIYCLYVLFVLTLSFDWKKKGKYYVSNTVKLTIK